MKEIFLTQNKVAIVDDEDYAELSKHKWLACQKQDRWYAKRTSKSIYMHRVIMGNPAQEVDHISGDGLDNRRCNLRLANRSQQLCNTRLRRDNKSGVKGVDWFKPKGKWRARVKIYGKEIHLGYFKNIQDAVEARLKAAREIHGEFARVG